MSDQIVVVGCGVTGLSTGIKLLEANYKVKIVTDKMPHDTVSAVAAAAWFPYHAGPIDKVIRWSEETRVELLALSEADSSLVYPISLRELHEQAPDTDPEWLNAVPSYQWIAKEDLPKGFTSGLSTTIPMIETPLYIDWLLNRYAMLGGTIELGEKVTSFAEIEADIIINCTGIGSYTLCNDQAVHPIRGLIALVTNPGVHTMTICTVDGNPTYLIPRRNEVVLGGTTDEGVWDESIDEQLLTEIIARCEVLEPKIADAELIQYRSGLRPGRDEVRLEMEEITGRKVIHNYGHGGSGYVLSWGCANEVVELVQKG